ncbi:helix-turn-helix domain-containing protein [Candidatus Amarolinea dominans]|uniref:helix-turn-helix domain-containing protein n=1 Tax=Candidatus Amarolinea dominans TaxID=3140696 RepID=UPI003135B588|nr:helix-turn-helix domain-containing protein [Anaerolineae bacterium]
MTTLADLLRLALPQGTHLLAGQEHLQRAVSWAISLRPSPPAFPHLNGGELILMDLADLALLDPSLSLARVIADLAAVRVAAIAVLGTVDEEAVSAASQLHSPLFALPVGSRLTDVEREAIRVIVNRQAQLERFASQVTHELTNLLVSGASLDQVAQTLARHANCTITVHGLLGDLLAAAAPGGRGLDEGLLADLHTETARLLQEQPGEASFLAALPNQRGSRWVTIITSNHQRYGALSAIAPGNDLDDVAKLVAERGALTCALELGRRQTISAGELNRRRQFIRDLLAAPEPGAISLAQRGLQWSFELDRRQVSFYIGSDQPIPMPLLHRCAQLVEEELTQRRVSNLVTPEEETGDILVLCGLGPGKPARRGRRLAKALHDRLAAQLPTVTLRVGVGRSADGAVGLIQSINEAAQALQLSKRIRGTDPVSYYGDMGLFRLLLPLQGSDVLRKFYDETLGALAAYDARQQASLVETLAAYFAHHGNLSRTAEALFLHRNTLLYRMERIAAIIGHDLNDPEMRLLLQVAFKVQQLL